MKRALVLLALAACSRHADLRAEQFQPSFKPPPSPTAEPGTMKEVDAGLGKVACKSIPYDPGCEDPVGEPTCGAFDTWLPIHANKCQQQTNCATNGFLEVTVGDQGCIIDVKMDQPNDAMIACLSQVFTSQRCTCDHVVTGSYFFGLGNHSPCGAGACSAEFPCPSGQHCNETVCVPD